MLLVSNLCKQVVNTSITVFPLSFEPCFAVCKLWVVEEYNINDVIDNGTGPFPRKLCKFAFKKCPVTCGVTD
jgi:hypothetical protein